MNHLLDKFFRLSENHTSIKTEILAGLTTFSTMAYIIIVNPRLLSETGMDFGAVMVATIIASFIGTMCMGLYANYPFALAPGMGLNAYFTYGIVLGAEHTWEIALGICFIAGICFLLLNLFGIRERIMNAVPASLRLATVGGVGILLAFIGLKNIHLVVPHAGTLVTLGKMATPEIVLACFGLLLIATLMARNVKGAIFISILVNWILGLAFGLVQWKGIVDLPPSIAPTFFKLEILDALHPSYIPMILSFVFVAIFDTTGTLIGLAEQGNFLDRNGKLPRANRALTNDAIGTLAGSVMGTSTITTYLESAAGVAVGGRTGLTAAVVALLFLLSLFFVPFAASIPYFATSPALIVIGAMMLQPIKRLDWTDPSEYIPAFIILATIPLTFSIASGIALGFVTYPLIKLFSGRKKEVDPLVWAIAFLFLLKFKYT